MAQAKNNGAIRNAKSYWRRKYAVFALNITVVTALLALFQFTGLSGNLANAALRVCGNPYTALTVYLITAGLAYFILVFPIDFYEGYALERAYGLSGRRLKDWLSDEIKKRIVISAIFLFLMNIFYFVSRHFGPAWWFVSAAFWIIFSILFAGIFPVVIIPLFYRYRPITDPQLRDAIFLLADRFAIKVMDVFEIDFSKTTRKSNAAVIGWGGSRRVILADNLINEFTLDEVRAVVAHEMAHHKFLHMWKLMALSSGLIMALFFILSLAIGLRGMAPLVGTPSMIGFLPSVFLIFILLNFITSPLENAFSRKLEAEADRAAIKIAGSKGAFISMMQKLAVKNMADPDPNRFIEILFYTHPPISKRIEMARSFYG